jgi:hypothetical protein
LDLEELKASLSLASDSHVKTVGRASKAVKGVLILGGALVAGIAQFVTWPDGTPAAPAQVVGIAATFIVALGGLYSWWTESDAADALRVAEKAVDGVRDAQSKLREFEPFFSAFDRMSETYSFCLTFRHALEQASVGVTGDIDDHLRTLLKQIERSLVIAAGFEQADRYTIVLYRAVPAAEAGKFDLKPIAHKRALECDLAVARTWPEGVGIAGIAYTNGREVIIPDLLAEGMQAVFGPRGQSKDSDSERYISMVAVPIVVAGNDRPWGVLAATSDQAEHFCAEGAPGFKTDEPIRTAAAFFELAIAMRETMSRSSISPPSTVVRRPTSPLGRNGVSDRSTRG